MSPETIKERFNQRGGKALAVEMDYLEGGKYERWTFRRSGSAVVIDVPAMTRPEDIVDRAISAGKVA